VGEETEIPSHTGLRDGTLHPGKVAREEVRTQQ